MLGLPNDPTLFQQVVCNHSSRDGIVIEINLKEFPKTTWIVIPNSGCIS